MATAATTSTESNRQTVRDAFDAWRDGTGATTEIVAPEMVWRMEGRSLASGDYAGGNSSTRCWRRSAHGSAHQSLSARWRFARLCRLRHRDRGLGWRRCRQGPLTL
jgi:ketosteroid isomerase-like protein